MVTDEKNWLMPQERLSDGTPKEWTDWIYRLSLKLCVELKLKELLKMTEDEEMKKGLLLALLSLNNYFDVNERVIQRHEGRRAWDRFRLLHRRLAGAATEFLALADRKPEQSCGPFKARQVNQVLVAMKELLAEEEGLSLPLVSESGDMSYGDVSLLLRGWLDLCAEYAWRHYDGNPPDFPSVDTTFREDVIREMILAFCQEGPKSALEIGEMLCYRNKKTVRRYIDPLLASGRLVRTVPDKPNSRNQKYLTARMI